MIFLVCLLMDLVIHGEMEGDVEPSGVQALKNPNPLKDVEG